MAFDRLITASIARRLIPPTPEGVRRFAQRLQARPLGSSLISFVAPINSDESFGPYTVDAVDAGLSQPRFTWWSICTFVNGQLRWNFHFHDEVIRAERARPLAHQTAEHLRSAVSQVRPRSR